MVAFDISFSWAGVTPDDVKAAGGTGVLVYSGGARPSAAWTDSMRAAGLTVAWVFESATDRALAGYDAGVTDCRNHESRVPAGELSYVVACDLNNGALGGRDVTAYLHGWADTTREPVFGQYGSSDAIIQGMTINGKLQRFWGVAPWCPVNKPNNHPDNLAYWNGLGVHLIQLVGEDIPGTDTNITTRPDWGTSTTTPTPTPGDDDDMKGSFFHAAGDVTTYEINPQRGTKLLMPSQDAINRMVVLGWSEAPNNETTQEFLDMFPTETSTPAKK